MNKRSLSEVDGMDVDENISHKKIKTHPQDDQTISEEIFSKDLKKMVLFQKKVYTNASIFLQRRK